MTDMHNLVREFANVETGRLFKPSAGSATAWTSDRSAEQLEPGSVRSAGCELDATLPSDQA